MTRRDFELIAGVIAEAESEHETNGPAYDAIGRLAYRFARELAGTNPRFDSGRFLRYALPLHERAAMK